MQCTNHSATLSLLLIAISAIACNQAGSATRRGAAGNSAFAGASAAKVAPASGGPAAGPGNLSVDFTGAIQSITLPSQLVVAGRLVIVDPKQSKILVNNNPAALAALAVGETARVQGTQQADLSVIAKNIFVTVAATPSLVASAGADQTVASGGLVTLQGSVVPATNNASFAWTQSAGTPVALAATASPTFTAPAVPFGAPPALLTFSLVVTSSNVASAPSTVTITVSPLPPPPPPLAPIADAGPDQAVNSGAVVTLDGLASTDPSGLELTYAWSQTAGPAVPISGLNAAGPAFFAPTVPFNTPPVLLTFSVTVSDANASSAPAFVNITVNPAPPPLPYANAGVSQAVDGGSLVTLDGSSSFDPTGEAITFAWTQTSGPAVVLSAPTSAVTTFIAPSVDAGQPVAILNFSLVVSHAQGNSTARVTISVNPLGSAFPPPPGAPPTVPPGTTPLANGGSGSQRFEMGTGPQGIYMQDPAAGENTLDGIVTVTMKAIGNGSVSQLPPLDTIVTLNGIPLLRRTDANGLEWIIDPAQPAPAVGPGGQIVLIASATLTSVDNNGVVTSTPIKRQLVLPCAADIDLTTTPSAGGVITGLPSVNLSSPSDITLNAPSPIFSGTSTEVVLMSYDRASRAITPSGVGFGLGPGPLNTDVVVTPTRGDAYIMELSWPGPFVVDGQSGGFCGIRKRTLFAR
jgi:hypothetical protein